MPDKPSDFEPQTLWQSQPTEHDPMTVAAIHQKAQVFQAKIRRRNLIEYIAAAVVIVGFAPALVRGNWMMHGGAALIMAATAFIVWQLHKRGSAAAVPPVGDSLVDFHRRELMRQRDALRSIAVWYLAPFVPGMSLFLIGEWFMPTAPLFLISRWTVPAAPNHTVAQHHVALLVTVAFQVLIFLGIWLLNQWGARRLQRRIDELG